MRLAIKPFKPRRAATLRHLSADPQLSPPDSPPPRPPGAPSPITQTLSLLQTTDPSSWSTNSSLISLLSSLPPPSVLILIRRLSNYQNALRFFNYLRTINSTLTVSIPFAFQAVVEHALRENTDSLDKCHELLFLSKDPKIPLSANAVTLLIKLLGGANMLDEMVAVFDSIDDEMKNTDVLNFVVSGFLKWGRVDDALKVLDEMFKSDTCFPPNMNTAGIVFSNILKRTWSGRSVTDDEIYKLVSSFSKCGVVLSGFLLTQVIMRFCRNRDYDKAWNVLQDGMTSSSAGVEVAACNSLLTGLGQNHDFSRMNLLMKEMNEKEIKPDVITYGIMIKHLCRFRRIDEALEVLNKMRGVELGVEPDVVIYNTLIDGLCKVGRHEEGLKLVDKMRIESKCEPNTITYNCLIDGFCKAGELEKGRELYERMRKENVGINVVTLNTLLDGMCKHDMVSSALEYFNEMQKTGLRGNTITYTNLITAFCNANNIEKAMRLFDEMRENGCRPDAVVYYSLISGLTQAGRMDEAMLIFSKMKESGFRLDIVGYNILIGGFCRRNKLDRAMEILKDMESSGLKSDRVTYNTLLSYFCNNGDFTHAHKVMKKMIDDGLTPTVVTYGTLIHAYCTSGNLETAMKIFRDMCSSTKVSPNTVIYNILVDAHCQNDDVEGAIELMEDMEARGVRPNSNTYNGIFKGLQARKWFEKALEYMDRMNVQGCNPDYVTMEILTEWLSAVGETEKLRKFVAGAKVSSLTA